MLIQQVKEKYYCQLGCVIFYVIVCTCLELYFKNTCVHDFIQCLFYMTNIYSYAHKYYIIIRENRRSN